MAGGPRQTVGDHGADTIDRLIADPLPLFAAALNPKNGVP